MVNNNHQFQELESSLLGQNFVKKPLLSTLDHYMSVAQMYSQVESSVAVLSDLSQNKSYIYHGAFSQAIGLASHHQQQIDSIWEDEIYERIHPDDLTQRNIQELYFFRMIEKMEISERHNFMTHSHLRMKDAAGQYIPALHRTIYLCSQENGALWLVLCLYNFSALGLEPKPFVGVIQDCKTGRLYTPHITNSSILSERELEILRLVEQGQMSKTIAHGLGLSVNTINRHRQNIFEKLRVHSSIEAIGVARNLRIL